MNGNSRITFIYGMEFLITLKCYWNSAYSLQYLENTNSFHLILIFVLSHSVLCFTLGIFNCYNMKRRKGKSCVSLKKLEMKCDGVVVLD